MAEHEIELMKLQLQRDLQEQQARERSEQRWSDLFKWFVALIWPLLVNGGAGYIQNRATTAVAAEVKTELTAAKTETDAKLSDIAGKQDVLVVSADANIKSLKAWKSGEPEDQNAATQAVVNAERLTENMPPVTPKP